MGCLNNNAVHDDDDDDDDDDATRCLVANDNDNELGWNAPT